MVRKDFRGLLMALPHLREEQDRGAASALHRLASFEALANKLILGVGFRQICCWGVQLLFHSSLN